MWHRKRIEPRTKTMQAQIDTIAANFPFGSPSAVKRGRFPQWPYVALITDYMGQEGVTHNPMGRRAYATREEAVAAAGRYLNVLRAKLRADLADPRMRALREQYGLPREL
jgi:hypothetical protein